MDVSKNKLCIIGAGAYGTALSVAFAENFKQVVLHTIEVEVMEDINKNSTNSKYLKDIQMPTNIKATTNYADIEDCDIVIISIPTQYIKDSIAEIISHNKKAYYIIASKGIDIARKKLISEVVYSEVQDIKLGVLSGPSFALELAQGVITNMVLATNSIEDAKALCGVLATQKLRLYYSDDIIGSQIGGAVKNVIALAGGIVGGLNLGYNSLCALITRGLNEFNELNHLYGGKKETLYGLSGMGDLILTATSSQSRNYSLGYAIGKQGYFSPNLLEQSKGTCEGYHTAKALHDIIKENNLNMPISKEVFEICYNNKKVLDSISSLMSREIVMEQNQG